MALNDIGRYRCIWLVYMMCRRMPLSRMSPTDLPIGLKSPSGWRMQSLDRAVNSHLNRMTSGMSVLLHYCAKSQRMVRLVLIILQLNTVVVSVGQIDIELPVITRQQAVKTSFGLRFNNLRTKGSFQLQKGKVGVSHQRVSNFLITLLLMYLKSWTVPSLSATHRQFYENHNFDRSRITQTP